MSVPAGDAALFPSILELPFFEPRHQRLAAELDLWAARELPRMPPAEGAENEAARRIGRALAEGGWFELLVGDSSDAGASGAAPDVRSLCIAREVLARHDGFADFVFALQGLGSAAILLAGSPEQRRRHLPGVLDGSRIPAFALTEAGAGSDAAAIETRAERDGGDYVLNGTKSWISNAGIADLHVVFARTAEAPGARGISAFVVEAQTPGLRVTEQVDIIAPHVIGSLEFEACRVPASHRLGQPGEGFKIAMSVLDIYRATVGAAAVGLAKRAVQEVVPHASGRRLFGQALVDFQATRMRLADMAARIEASALLVYRSAWVKDVLDRRVSYESSLAKLVATEEAQAVIDSGVQLMGGAGVRKGAVLERLYRDIRPMRIYEGASEIQKLVIAEQMLRRWQDLEAAARPGD